jgi:hypothetical protein
MYAFAGMVSVADLSVAGVIYFNFKPDATDLHAYVMQTDEKVRRAHENAFFAVRLDARAPVRTELRVSFSNFFRFFLFFKSDDAQK